MKKILRTLIPEPILNIYHLVLAWYGASHYGNPSRKMTVIGITGTKGKTTVTELVYKILKTAGHRPAVVSSMYFKIDEETRLNKMGVTMPGRFYIQKFLKEAADRGCTHAIIEVTSQGILQHRHRFIDYDITVFLNLSEEHIEAHGSMENYREAKLQLFNALASSSKKKRVAVLNEGDVHYDHFRKRVDQLGISDIITFNRDDIKDYHSSDQDARFLYDGHTLHTSLLGGFNAENVLAALACARAMHIPVEKTLEAIKQFEGIPGRLEFIQRYPFAVVVDYAHTPHSLESVYDTIKKMSYEGSLNLVTNYKTPGPRMICVLGAAGGGRDRWKRPEMGRIASYYCDELILTDEDPYDDDPQEIINDIKEGVNPNVSGTMDMFELLDRRRAIEIAVEHARSGDFVIITGKGAEPWLHVKDGKRIPWSDSAIAREALQKKLEQGAEHSEGDEETQSNL